MKVLAAATLVATAFASVSASPTLYVVGDSTMAPGGGGNGTKGWGEYIGTYTTISVVNRAIAGRSARSYTRDGRFNTLAQLVQPSDIVVIEFGHNDGGTIACTANDNFRADCPGEGAESCTTTYQGNPETVLTYNTFLINAAKLLQSKQAAVIFSAMTPSNPYETGKFNAKAPTFVAMAANAAKTANVAYIDHFNYVNAYYKPLGAAKVDTFFPNDHTHTSPEGAALVAQAFAKGVSCSQSTLKPYLKTTNLPGSCL